MNTAFADIPALRYRAMSYPQRFHGRVPKTVRPYHDVGADDLVCLAYPEWRGVFAHGGAEYPAWTNSYGAVSVILQNGKHFGLKPDEFEVVEWYPVEEMNERKD